MSTRSTLRLGMPPSEQLSLLAVFFDQAVVAGRRAGRSELVEILSRFIYVPLILAFDLADG